MRQGGERITRRYRNNAWPCWWCQPLRRWKPCRFDSDELEIVVVQYSEVPFDRVGINLDNRALDRNAWLAEQVSGLPEHDSFEFVDVTTGLVGVDPTNHGMTVGGPTNEHTRTLLSRSALHVEGCVGSVRNVSQNDVTRPQFIEKVSEPCRCHGPGNSDFTVASRTYQRGRIEALDHAVPRSPCDAGTNTVALEDIPPCSVDRQHVSGDNPPRSVGTLPCPPTTGQPPDHGDFDELVECSVQITFERPTHQSQETRNCSLLGRQQLVGRGSDRRQFEFIFGVDRLQLVTVISGRSSSLWLVTPLLGCPKS